MLLISTLFLGGVVRTTISLCVMLVEGTGNIGYALPLTATLVASKWTGDYFTKGIYDVNIELQHIPLLGPLFLVLLHPHWISLILSSWIEWEPPVVTRKFAAEDVMNSPVVCLKKVDNVGRYSSDRFCEVAFDVIIKMMMRVKILMERFNRIYSVLRGTTHNGFPIVNDSGVLVGLVLRSQLITILKHKAFQLYLMFSIVCSVTESHF